MNKKLTRKRFICSVAAVAPAMTVSGIKGLIPEKKKSREEIISEINAIVDKNLPVYRTCSQTTFHALNEVFHLKADEFIRALAPFPGIAMRGETCGTVTASLCAIALSIEDKKPGVNLSVKPSGEFCSRFEKLFGSTRCRDVIKYMTKQDFKVFTPEDYNVLIREGALNHCGEVIKKAASIAVEIILEGKVS